MTEPYELYKAQRAEASDFNLKTLKLPTAFRTMQVEDIDKLEPGAVAACTLGFGTTPITGDTVTIGTDVYEFLDTGEAVADDDNIAVELGGMLTVDSFVDAINAVDVDNLHANLTLIDAVTAAKTNGTEKLLAFKTSGGSQIVIQSAVAAGGAKTPANPSIVLGETLTAVGDFWFCGDVNMNTLGGLAASPAQGAVITRTITAAMLTAGGRLERFAFPFTVTRYTIQVRTAAGATRLTQNDVTAIALGHVELTLAGGIAPDIQSGDIVTVQAWT